MIFRPLRRSRDNAAAMTVFPDTQAVTLQDPSRRPATRDTFLSQTPLALVAIVAVAAIVAVNVGDTGKPQQAAAASPAVAVSASCADCGEIVSISPIQATEPAAAGAQLGRVFEVRMSDGSVRIVRHPAGGFAVGDRIRVEGNALKRSK
jgi:hypothetical protein